LVRFFRNEISLSPGDAIPPIARAEACVGMNGSDGDAIHEHGIHRRSSFESFETDKPIDSTQ
jgi:hypothetical protein